MTRDDIIAMAREAGSIDSEEVIETVWSAFSAAEREACAQVMRQALDALENHTAIKHPQQISYRDDAIAALRAALSICARESNE